ncbi:n6-adenine-specific dna methylase [Leptolyngbya sp. Heron Island J]|uniref:BREX-6 system adenine-specific DNA-methyltransferase PglX n=1 Tax=Leptolyngbya sp. Heron Island J TaxID=1385935 RepID=UPI0003B96E01|nr:BREX-6 system adenine-specific DNA-methyltransferase PglX [Leptolyngbya sp. Heron Island J]ESA32468.1 n6-adenine-specific dna methylase [Leptolyngbya sp. Heron Island J]
MTMTLTPDAKNKLSQTVRNLRGTKGDPYGGLLLKGLREAAESTYRLSIGSVNKAGLWEAEREKRLRLEDWLKEQVRADVASKMIKDKPEEKAASRERHLLEAIQLAGATLLNRLVVIKQLEAQGLMKPMVVTDGWQSAGYREFREFAPDLCKDDTEGYGLLLQLVYDELALELPGLFGKVGLTELFPVPAQTLRAVVEALNVAELESAWTDDTTLGWVYQYWNDPQREAIDDRLDNEKGIKAKVAPHEIASKTQMFTERYMVEWLLQNSLGQQWLAICHRNKWKPEVFADGTIQRLEARRKDWRAKREAEEVALDVLMPIESAQEERWKYWVLQDGLDPKGIPGSIRDIKIFDPACGSGHFLVIAFDLLVAFYQEEARHRGEGWEEKEIVEAILENNLYGLDLDPRAVQIAAASLYLKGKAVCREAQPRVLNLVASNLNLAALPENDPARQELRQAVEESTGIPAKLTDEIVEALSGADAWGSLLRVDDAVNKAIGGYEKSLEKPVQLETDSIGQVVEEKETNKSLSGIKAKDIRGFLLAKLETFLSRCTRSDDLGLRLKGEQLAAGVRFLRIVREGCYDLVVGNPPYQGASKMADDSYLKNHYKRGSADLFAAFLERSLQLVKHDGISSMITMRNWMFIKQYKDLREWFVDKYDIRTLGDVSWGAFSAMKDNPVTMSVIKKAPVSGRSFAIAPTDPQERVRSAEEIRKKVAGLLCGEKRFEFETSRFDVIKEKPLIYWWNEAFLKQYAEAPKLEDEADVKQGMATADNTRFLRKPWEIKKISFLRRCSLESPGHEDITGLWMPYIKGASGKKWFEPLSEIILYQSNMLQIHLMEQGGKKISTAGKNENYYFQYGVAFTSTGNSFTARCHRFRSVFDVKGQSTFPKEPLQAVCLMNSQTAQDILSALNPSISFQVGDAKRLPLFPIESADKIFAQLDTAFTEHEAARETSVEFQHPGPSCWTYAQAWAQQAVDRPAGKPLPLWDPTYEESPATAWISYAVGKALGRFPLSSTAVWAPLDLRSQPPRALSGVEGLPHGILYLSDYSGNNPDGPDSLNHPASKPIHDAWANHGSKISNNNPLHHWLREKFFQDIHLPMYSTKTEKRPIYFPLSSKNKTFVALISIHRWADDTLQTLLADYLTQDKRTLEGELADLATAKTQGDVKTQAQAEDRAATLQAMLNELDKFIALVRQCAETGPPPAKDTDPKPKVTARYTMDLDDGVMINSAALWPLLDPQWKKPKTWWSELCNAQGKKDYDWSHLAARYFPERVDKKCQDDPSLAVAHGCFWKYHATKAYEWELRLQDEIAPDFTIDETDSDQHRQQFETDNPKEVQKLKDKEDKRREKNRKKQLNLQI